MGGVRGPLGQPLQGTTPKLSATAMKLSNHHGCYAFLSPAGPSITGIAEVLILVLQMPSTNPPETCHACHHCFRISLRAVVRSSLLIAPAFTMPSVAPNSLHGYQANVFVVHYCYKVGN